MPGTDLRALAVYLHYAHLPAIFSLTLATVFGARSSAGCDGVGNNGYAGAAGSSRGVLQRVGCTRCRSTLSFDALADVSAAAWQALGFELSNMTRFCFPSCVGIDPRKSEIRGQT